MMDKKMYEYMRKKKFKTNFGTENSFLCIYTMSWDNKCNKIENVCKKQQQKVEIKRHKFKYRNKHFREKCEIYSNIFSLNMISLYTSIITSDQF